MSARYFPPISPMALLFLLGLFTASCDLESVTGPEGPPGPEGPAGASLISRTLTVTNEIYVPGYSVSFTANGRMQRPARVATVTDARLTQEVIESGAILLYMEVPESLDLASPTRLWTPLPFQILRLSGQRALWSWSFDARPGELRILFYIDPLGDSPLPSLNSVTIPTMTFRMVLIPPG